MEESYQSAIRELQKMAAMYSRWGHAEKADELLLLAEEMKKSMEASGQEIEWDVQLEDFVQ